MIVFTSNINLIPYINNAMIYNLSSYYSGYNDITKLITKIQIINNTEMLANEFIYSPYFDNIYYNSILNDHELFCCLLQLMMNVYNGNNAIVLISHDNYRDAITESLIKLIQVRYGYNCWEIENVEDLDILKETHFTPQGIQNLDADKQTYDSILLKYGVNLESLCKE